MVPFSFHQALLKSRVMNKYISSSATVGVRTPGALGLESDVFTLSCFPVFLILISVSVFPSCPSFPSVSKNRGPWCRSTGGVDHRPSRWEPNGRDGVSPLVSSYMLLNDNWLGVWLLFSSELFSARISLRGICSKALTLIICKIWWRLCESLSSLRVMATKR